MIYKLSDEVETQIKFYQSNIDNQYTYNAHNHSLLYTNPPKSSDPIIKYDQEIISDKTKESELFKIIDELRLENSEIYLSTSTITPCKYQLHPLVNIHAHWSHFQQRTYADNNWDTKEEGFSDKDYDYTKKLEFDKTNKSILSVRKKTFYRDYFLNKIIPDELGIFRYISYDPWIEYRPDQEHIYTIQFPTWKELQSEYKKSIFSFVVETDFSHEGMSCQISEKTLLAFLSGTIPIVIGPRNMVKLLKDIGFYVWNTEFGYFPADSSSDGFIRADKFVECYDNVKKLSFEESKEIWLYNQGKIQQNYDIVSNLLMRKYWN